MSDAEISPKPTDQQLVNIARAIGGTAGWTNHIERARAVYRAAMMEGDHELPTNAMSCEPGPQCQK